jgi:hydrogenase expression/formation protein HypD
LVAAGFEPLDILQSVWMILKQLKNGEAKIENQYARLVNDTGNASALSSIAEVFELRDFFEWRGLGSINHSGVKINEKYSAFDAEVEFNLKEVTITDPDVCQCGEVLKGILKPWQCKVFGKECTTETPLGAIATCLSTTAMSHSNIFIFIFFIHYFVLIKSIFCP